MARAEADRSSQVKAVNAEILFDSVSSQMIFFFFFDLVYQGFDIFGFKAIAFTNSVNCDKHFYEISIVSTIEAPTSVCFSLLPLF